MMPELSPITTKHEIREFNPNPSQRNFPAIHPVLATAPNEDEKMALLPLPPAKEEIKAQPPIFVPGPVPQLGVPLKPLPEKPSPARLPQQDPAEVVPAVLLTCVECNRQFTDPSSTIYLSCMHSYCIECLKNKAFREFPENGQVLCKCNKPTTDSELQACLVFSLCGSERQPL